MVGGVGVLAVALRVGADRGPRAGAGTGDGLQRVSIGVNVLLVSHMLTWVGFRATVLLAAGISVAFIPLALWGRQFEPSRKSLELASGDQVLAPAIVGPPDPGVAPGAFTPVSP